MWANFFFKKNPKINLKSAFGQAYIRWLCLRYLIQQLAFRLLTVLLIALDIALIVADLAIDCPADHTSRVISYVDLVRKRRSVLVAFLHIVLLLLSLFLLPLVSCC